MTFVEDPNLFVAGLDSQVVTFGAYSSRGYLDQPDDEILDGDVQSTEYSLRFITAALPGMTPGAAVSIGGVAYKIRDNPRKEDNGTFSRVSLSKV